MINRRKTLCGLSGFLVFSTFFLIFAGAMVTSTDSGLAVPDWPLSYGKLFPPMVAGIFYEHGHRMVATFVGLLTILLVVCVHIWDKARFARYLSLGALALVIFQGLLGGLTVYLQLPVWVSVFHTFCAQLFLLTTLFIWFFYKEKAVPVSVCVDNEKLRKVLTGNRILLLIVYIQNIMGALVRHTHSALAYPDFPLFAGKIWPHFDEATLEKVHQIAFEKAHPYVEVWQMVLQSSHRIIALIVTAVLIWSASKTLVLLGQDKGVCRLVQGIGGALFCQIALGIYTIVTETAPLIASFHMLGGALLLAWVWVLHLKIGLYLSKEGKCV